MEFEDLLENLKSEYHANMAATCQVDPPWGSLLDDEKVKRFPSFYDWMVERGVARQTLSSHGIGRDISA
jgi:hypothetical protein